jgi:hypothetical protein
MGSGEGLTKRNIIVCTIHLIELESEKNKMGRAYSQNDRR